jgi:predicted nuclease of restriction endonuclease-like (RecB) superfamily
MKTKPPVGPDYAAFLTEVKGRIISARLHAARAVNRDLINLYWDIGRSIVEKQETLGWGESVVEMLSRDLQKAFPQMRGFSVRNLWYVRRLYAEYTEPLILQQVAAELARKQSDMGRKADALARLQQLAAEIPWGHHMLLMDRIPDAKARLYYLRATAQLGWSRNVLLTQIKAGAYERAVTEKIDVGEEVAA